MVMAMAMANTTQLADTHLLHPTTHRRADWVVFDGQAHLAAQLTEFSISQTIRRSLTRDTILPNVDIESDSFFAPSPLSLVFGPLQASLAKP